MPFGPSWLPSPPTTEIAAGFPGMVRGGRVISAPHFVTKDGPGTATVPLLEAAWSGYDLAGALEKELGKPARVTNDADLQGGAVVKGEGLEVVITHRHRPGQPPCTTRATWRRTSSWHTHPFRKGQTYDEQVGDAARKRIGKKKWNKRVQEAVRNIDTLLIFRPPLRRRRQRGPRGRRPWSEGDDRRQTPPASSGGLKLWDPEPVAGV